MTAVPLKILIVYHSRLGSVQKMARLIARGVESCPQCSAVLRTVPEVVKQASPATKDEPHQENSNSDDPFVELQDLIDCHGLVIGSPTRFGNMSAAMKYFIDETSPLWMSGALSGKPAGVFTSTSSMHGGQESTLLSMMTPLLHQGMLISGIPYTETALSKTESGGTPYGASHVAGISNNNPISKDEKTLCMALGKRIAQTAYQLSNVG